MSQICRIKEVHFAVNGSGTDTAKTGYKMLGEEALFARWVGEGFCPSSAAGKDGFRVVQGQLLCCLGDRKIPGKTRIKHQDRRRFATRQKIVKPHKRNASTV